MLFFLLAFLIGALLSTVAPVMLFVVCVLTLAIAGFASELWSGVPALSAALSTFGAFAGAQLGYAAALAVAAFRDMRRARAKRLAEGAGAFTAIHHEG